MMTIGKFYRQTWWLWLIFAAMIAALCYLVSVMFIFGFPLLVAYSVFFGFTRVNDINKDEAEKKRKSNPQ